MSDDRHTPALPDDVLVRYLDGETTEDDRARMERDGADTVRLWELREASDLFSSLVDDIPLPAAPPLAIPEPRTRPLALKAAVIALLTLSGAVAAMPVARTLVVRAADSIADWLAGTPPADPDARATVAFDPTSPVLRIEVERAQISGFLVITRASTEQVEIDAESADLLVLPTAVRVRNGLESDGDVTVRVPRSVRAVEVVIAGERVDVSLSTDTDVVHIPLSPQHTG